MGHINYANKEALNKNPEIADINKVTDDDMNEIKQVVNDNYDNTIVISDTQPTSEDNKIWIDTGEVQNLGSEVHIGSEIDSKIGLNILYSKNLFDVNSMIELTGQVRRYSDGVVVSVSNYSGIKVPVNPNTTYTITTNGDYSNLAFYNSSYTYISGESFTHSNESVSFTTPANCYYISLAISNSTTQTMLNLGSTALPYQPYITPTINVYGEDIYSMPVILYSNSSGNNGSITLSDSASNYKYLEIYYSNTSGGNQRMSMQKFDTSLGSTKCALFIITADSGGAMYLTNRDVNISGTTISTLDNTRYSKGIINFNGGGIVTTTPVNEIFIYKVVGYKE